MQRSPAFRIVLGVTAAPVLAATILTQMTASAGAGGFGFDNAVNAGKAILDQAARAARGKVDRPASPGHSKSKGSGGDDNGDGKSSEKSSEKSSKNKSADERATDQRNYATQRAELDEIRRTEQLERERNVQQAIRRFVAELERWHRELRGNDRTNVKVSTGASINQVTEGEVKRAVEAAYKIAQLYEFEMLAGELWTRDRLLVRILDRSQKELEDFFHGVGVKGTSMSDLEQIFERSARHVHGQALQVAELIGVSYSFDRFIRIIFEQSDRTDEGLWTVGADGHYERLVSGIVDSIPRQTFVSDEKVLASDPLGLDQHFTFRFRARRALYDCMAVQYVQLIPTGNQGGTIQVAARGDGRRSNGGLPHVQQEPAPATSSAGGAATFKPAAAVTAGDQGDIWTSLRKAANKVCGEKMSGVLSQVTAGRIRPKPARWDSGVVDSAGQQRSPFLPSVGTKPIQ